MSSTNNYLNKDIPLTIKRIFEENELDDLKRFLGKRQCLNNCNLFLMYLFHLVQSAGILTTAIATGKNDENLIWIGVALNILASLINIYEKTNNSILKKLLKDIQLIKKGNYVDEGAMIDTEDKPASDSEEGKSSAAKKQGDNDSAGNETTMTTPLIPNTGSVNSNYNTI